MVDFRRGPREQTWTKRTPEERRAKHLAKSRRNYKQSNANKKAKRLALKNAIIPFIPGE